MSSRYLVIAAGDPAGCGPLITLRAIEQLYASRVIFFITGDRKIFEQIAIYKKLSSRVNLIDLNTPGIGRLKKGFFSHLSGKAGLSYLSKALEIISRKQITRLVTAPLSKEAVQLIYPEFSGHTEYLAGYFKVKNIAMMMASSNLRVVLLTRHIPLSKVASAIHKNDIKKTLTLVSASLKRQFKINNPRIAFCSLNPHAGVDTFLGKEEREILAAAREFGKPVFGPYPADAMFIKENLKKYDCIICAYHDQAMVPFKLLSFREGVNVTLGLPIIRTSPIHGTAYDLIRQGKTPDHSSMVSAIKLALKLSP